MSKFRCKLMVAALVASCISLGSSANPTNPGGASEFTQLLNNVELFGINAQSVLAVEQQAEQYVKQLKQLERQIKDAASFGGIGQSVQNIARQIGVVQNYARKLQAVKADVSKFVEMTDMRKVEARLKGMNLKSYLLAEAEKIRNNDARARQRIQAEQDIINQTNEDIQAAQTLSKDIASFAADDQGLNKSIGLLNSQMNLMITQNARLTQIMGNSIGTEQANAINKENADAHAARQATANFSNAYQQSIERQERALDSAVNMKLEK